MSWDIGDLLATHSSREIACFAQIGLNPRQFKKKFQFSLTLRASSLSSSPFPLPKPPFSLTKPSFSSSILHQSSRKGIGFLLFPMYFMLLALDFLDFVFTLRFENMMFEYGFDDVLLSLVYGFC